MVRLLKDRVMVEFIDDDSETMLASGIILPKGDNDEREKRLPTQGVVVAVGPGALHGDRLIPVEVQIGARVIFDRYHHDEVDYKAPDGDKRKRYLIMKEKALLATIEE